MESAVTMTMSIKEVFYFGKKHQVQSATSNTVTLSSQVLQEAPALSSMVGCQTEDVAFLKISRGSKFICFATFVDNSGVVFPFL